MKSTTFRRVAIKSKGGTGRPRATAWLRILCVVQRLSGEFIEIGGRRYCGGRAGLHSFAAGTGEFEGFGLQ